MMSCQTAEQRKLGREGGQVAPILLFALVALALTGVALVQGGRLTTLQAEATTGADAAALAAADEIAEGLTGPEAVVFLATGEVPQEVVLRAEEAARRYARANNTELVDELIVVERGRRRVDVRLTTRTRDPLGEPALTEEIRRHRGEATAAARVELGVSLRSERGGCLSQAQVAAIAERAGLETPERSGLIDCRGTDVTNLRPQLHEAILHLERAMGEIVRFTAAYQSVEERLPVRRGQSVAPSRTAQPGLVWHQSGLAFDAGNHEAIATALEDSPRDLQLCQPHPEVEPEHFAHTDAAECGGDEVLAGKLLGIGVTEIRLIDPDQVPA